jgi:hypothetical protein
VSSELKPCPFCGEEAVIKKTRPHEWIIGCEGRYGSTCPGFVWKSTPVYLTKACETTAWNRRANNDKLQTEQAEKAVRLLHAQELQKGTIQEG